MTYIVSRNDLEKLPHRKQVMFALFCVKQVVHLVDSRDKIVCDRTIKTVKLWLEDKATAKQCEDVANDVGALVGLGYAISYAARTVYLPHEAGYYTASAVDAANYYAVNVNKDKLIKEQWDYYNALLNLDKYAEELLGG